jgi:hypothetical protein
VNVSEAQLQQAIVEAARLFGWLVFHARPAQTKRGWRTPMLGDRGFPDLVVAKPERCLALELKSDRGPLRPGQREWLDSLHGALVDARLVRPTDLDDVLALLSTRTQP